MKERAGYVLVALAAATVTFAGCYGLWGRQAEPAGGAAAMESIRSGSPLEGFESSRQQLRARERAQLNDIIHDDATDAETLCKAQRRLMNLAEAEAAEETLQASLRARGFEGAVVSAWSGGVNVFVPGEGLNRRESAIILEEVLRETGKTGGNVKIIPINSPKVFAQ